MGVIDEADGIGEVVGPVCGDQVVLYLKIDGGVISRAGFTTHGCWAAVAMASLLTEMARGLSPDQALALDGEAIGQEEAGLPEDKWPCARLVSQALHKAVQDWQKRVKTGEDYTDSC